MSPNYPVIQYRGTPSLSARAAGYSTPGNQPGGYRPASTSSQRGDFAESIPGFQGNMRGQAYGQPLERLSAPYPLPAVPAAVARAAIMQTARGLQSATSAFQGALGAINQAVGSSAEVAFNQMQVIHLRDFLADQRGGGKLPTLDQLRRRAGAKDPFASKSPLSPGLGRGQLTTVAAAKEILAKGRERAAREFAKEEAKSLRIGSILAGLDPRMFGMIGLAMLLEMILDWQLEGMSVYRAGGYTVTVPPNWRYLYTVAPCGYTHPPNAPYWPATETAEMRSFDPSWGEQHHVLPPIYDTGHVAVWAKSYALKIGTEIGYPALAYDALEVYKQDTPGPDWPTLTPGALTSMMNPFQMDPGFFPKGVYWPWPSLDPFTDPRSSPLAPPLGLPTRPIPVSWLPYVGPDPDRAPSEQTQRGPAPSEETQRGAPPEPPGFTGVVSGVLPHPPPAGEGEVKPNPKGVVARIRKRMKIDVHDVRALTSRAFSGVTEVADVVDCAYSSVPAASRLKWQPGKAITVDQKGALAAQEMAKGNFDASEFVACVAGNELKDQLIGGLHRAADKKLPKRPGLPGAAWMPSSFGVR